MWFFMFNKYIHFLCCYKMDSCRLSHAFASPMNPVKSCGPYISANFKDGAWFIKYITVHVHKMILLLCWSVHMSLSSMKYETSYRQFMDKSIFENHWISMHSYTFETEILHLTNIKNNAMDKSWFSYDLLVN